MTCLDCPVSLLRKGKGWCPLMQENRNPERLCNYGITYLKRLHERLEQLIALREKEAADGR